MSKDNFQQNQADGQPGRMPAPATLSLIQNYVRDQNGSVWPELRELMRSLTSKCGSESDSPKWPDLFEVLPIAFPKCAEDQDPNIWLEIRPLMPALIHKCTNENHPQAWNCLLRIAQVYVVAFYRTKGITEQELHGLEDLVQKALLKIYKYLHQLKNPAAFFGWIKKVAISTGQERSRAAGFKEQSAPSLDNPDNEGLLNTMASAGATAVDAIQQQEASLMAQKCTGVLMDCCKQLQTINPEGERAIRLHFHKGYSFDKIARLLKRTVEETKTIIARAIEQLAQLFKASLDPKGYAFFIILFN